MIKKSVLAILAVAVLVFTIVYFIGRRGQSDPISDKKSAETEIWEPTRAYGIVIDSMLVFTDRVKRNQYLSEILTDYGVPYEKIDVLARRTKPIFDVRKIRAGNSYTAICTHDTLQTLHYFVYEISPTEYVVFDIRDSIHVHRGEKEIERRTTTASGVIESSLWNAMVGAEIDPNLANELSEIYAWTIDFFWIQKGDAFKVYYDALYVDDEYIGIGNIHAAWMQHAGKDFYAYYFEVDSVGDYFDEEANSMRRTFLKAPLRFKRISSRFSYSRMHPILKRRMPHTGIDYAANYGTPVHAVGDGVVTFARRKGANGNIVKIRHNGTYTTAYLHLSKFGKGIKQGAYVKQGDVIGYVGSTGRSTGPHLDFRFYRNGQPVDPLKVKSPPAKPVDSAYLDVYWEHIRGLKQQLEGISIATN